MDAAPAADIRALPGGGGRGDSGAEMGPQKEAWLREPTGSSVPSVQSQGQPGERLLVSWEVRALGSMRILSGGIVLEWNRQLGSEPPRTQSLSKRKESFLN